MDAAVSVTEMLSIANKKKTTNTLSSQIPAKKCTILTVDTLTEEYPGNRPAQKSLYPRMTLWKMAKKKIRERKV